MRAERPVLEPALVPQVKAAPLRWRSALLLVAALVALPALAWGLIAATDVVRVGYTTFADRNVWSGPRRDVAALARHAKRAFEEPQADGSHRLCPSSTPLPAEMPRGGLSSRLEAREWLDAGFGCLRFETTNSLYHQYSYLTTDSEFVVTARGDIDSDGVESVFQITGTVVGDRVQLSQLDVRDEGE